MSVNAVCNGPWPLGLAGCWYGILLFMGLLPETPDAPGFLDFPYSDKVIHFGAYGMFGALLFMNDKLPVWCLTLAFVLALGQESCQLFVSERSFEWWDWLADCGGIIAGCFGIRTLRQRMEFSSVEAT